MSLTKEVAHDLRVVTTQVGELAVLPPALKVLPLAFYAGFAFFLLAFAYNNFQAKLLNAQADGLKQIIGQYQQMMEIDKQTTGKLIEQRNAAVRVARWVDYSPMVQGILVGIFGSMDDRGQITGLQIERKEAVRPEYTINLSLKAAQGDISGIISNLKDALAEKGWQLTTGNQGYQEGGVNFQGYLQPIDSVMPFESQSLPILQERGNPAPATNSVSAPIPGGGR